MEYAGSDLSKLIEREKRMTEDRVRKLGKEMVAAMFYLSQLKIVHRDLKPDNILLQEDQVKLCDFGFAKKMSASATFLKSIKGTPLYIAPEIIKQQAYTPKVDVWSLGVIFYEMAVGKRPFFATTTQVLYPKIMHGIVHYPTSLSDDLRHLIQGMLQKESVRRMSWEEVKNHKFFTIDIPQPLPYT